MVKNIIKKIDMISAIYAVFGFIFGFLLFYILEKVKLSNSNKSYLILIIVIIFISNLLLLDINKKISTSYWKTSLISSMLLSLFYYFIVKVNIENYPSKYYYSNDYESYLGFSLFFIYIVSILYLKSFITSKTQKISSIFSYTNLLKIFIEYNFKISSSFLVLGGLWIILSLWSVLFKLIDITIFYDILFNKSWYIPFVLSTTIYFGIYGIVNKFSIELRKIVSKLFILQIFLEIISAFLILFIIFLPIMGVSKIFSTGYSSAILLSLNTIGIVLIQFINFEYKEINKFRKYLVTSFIVLEPVFSFLAFYSIMIRVNQYGITPQRFIVMIIILLFNIFNLSYFYAVIKSKLNWRVYIKKQTPYLIIISAVIILLTITPILNPYQISVKSQLSIFGNNIEKLDLLSLKFKLSKPGKNAFNKLKIKYKNNKKIMKLIAKVDNCNSYWDCKYNNKNSNVKTGYKYPPIVLNIYPDSEKEPESFIKLLKNYYKSPSYYRNASIIIKDFLVDYEGKEIVLINNVWLMGEYRNYMAVFVKDENNKYKLFKENILPKKTIINVNNLGLIKYTTYNVIKEKNE